MRGSLGADDGILCRDEVGREPEPTLVFCGALDPFELDRVGELEMMAMSRDPCVRSLEVLNANNDVGYRCEGENDVDSQNHIAPLRWAALALVKEHISATRSSHRSLW